MMTEAPRKVLGDIGNLARPLTPVSKNKKKIIPRVASLKKVEPKNSPVRVTSPVLEPVVQVPRITYSREFLLSLQHNESLEIISEELQKLIDQLTSNDSGDKPHASVVEKKKYTAAENPKKRKRETDENRLQAREKQIVYGKRTTGYEAYLDQTSKNKRQKGDPKTPNKYQICSKRSWDGQIRKWRRDLHLFDPESSEMLEDVSKIENLSIDADLSSDKDLIVEDSGNEQQPMDC